MRLFVAITPAPAALAELEAAVGPWRARWPGLRWTRSGTWHVTLAFLGEVEPARLGALSARLERAAGRHAAQRVRLGPVAAVPSVLRARLLWAQVSGDRIAMQGLTALAASVAAGARRAGAPSPDEGRKYRPHLTLARARPWTDLSQLVEALSQFGGTGWEASAVELIESLPGSAPRYRTVESWPLRARAVPSA